MAGRRPLTLAATAALSLAVLFVGTLPRTPRALQAIPDWVDHLGAYAAISFMASRSATALGVTPVAAAAVAYAVAHGALLELLQSLVPTRTAEWRDLAADAVGAVVGALLAGAWRRRR